MNKELNFMEIDSHAAYQSYREKQAEELQRRVAVERALSAGKKPFHTPGFCYICDRTVEFRVDYANSFQWEGELMPNYREQLRCSVCGFNNRMRASVHVLEQKLSARGKVYITEQITPLFQLIKKRLGNVIGSEYLGSKMEPGQVDKNGIGNESVTKLSFADRSFDIIMSFDVFELFYWSQLYGYMGKGEQMLFIASRPQ